MIEEIGTAGRARQYRIVKIHENAFITLSRLAGVLYSINHAAESSPLIDTEQADRECFEFLERLCTELGDKSISRIARNGHILITTSTQVPLLKR